ncbi:hypothetical protein GE09DRAFT_1214818 [Coniochaeta sp. 2T2.1]|nr:hypothetical protein GE09DRAFT_1214818 [Coniochaeta sp. 2T2.1]
MCELEECRCMICESISSHMIYPCRAARRIQCGGVPARHLARWNRLMTCTSTRCPSPQAPRPRICEDCLTESAEVAVSEIVRASSNAAEVIQDETLIYELCELMARNLRLDVDAIIAATEYLEDETNKLRERELTAWVRDDPSPANRLPLVTRPDGEVVRQGEIWSWKMNESIWDQMLATCEGEGISCRVNIHRFDRLMIQPITSPPSPRPFHFLGSSAWVNIEGVVAGQAQLIGLTMLIYHPSLLLLASRTRNVSMQGHARIVRRLAVASVA